MINTHFDQTKWYLIEQKLWVRSSWSAFKFPYKWPCLETTNTQIGNLNFYASLIDSLVYLCFLVNYVGHSRIYNKYHLLYAIKIKIRIHTLLLFFKNWNLRIYNIDTFTRTCKWWKRRSGQRFTIWYGFDIDILWGCKIERIFLFADFGTFRAFSLILNLLLIWI